MKIFGKEGVNYWIELIFWINQTLKTKDREMVNAIVRAGGKEVEFIILHISEGWYNAISISKKWNSNHC